MATGARLARTSDVDDIAAVQVRAWRETFADLLPDEALEALDASEIATQWADAILRPPTPRHRVLVAIDAESGHDKVVGYAAVGPDDSPDAGPSTGAVFDLVVDPGHRRNGHGSRLMHAAVDHLLAIGMDTAVTWVLLADGPRRAFFESAGWGPDSAWREIEIGERRLREARLATALDAGTRQ